MLLIFLMKSRDPERYCDRVRAAKLERRWRKDDADAGARDSGTIAEADVLARLDALAAAKAAQAG